MDNPFRNRFLEGRGVGSPVPGEIILIFRGTHQVLSAEKHLKRAGVPMRLIPVPRSLTSDCGLAIRIFESGKERAREVLAAASLMPYSVHILRQEGGYENGSL